MKKYKSEITINKNARGCYVIDTVKGCSVCAELKPRGCYDDCYAKNIAGRYGFVFSEPVKREFKHDNKQLYLLDFYDTDHENKIINIIKNNSMPFVRIGEMGDPSEDWRHTIDICKIISKACKPIVVITKHWKTIPTNLLKEIQKLNICINTSISALDDVMEIDHRLTQYNRLKPYCSSVLRIVSCDFNIENDIGKEKSIIQEKLFMNENIIDTIFRPRIDNDLVTKKIINVTKTNFLKSSVLASVYSKKTYFGKCNDCPDMCGIKFSLKPIESV